MAASGQKQTVGFFIFDIIHAEDTNIVSISLRIFPITSMAELAVFTLNILIVY
jgi:hypothetical protein